MTNSHDPAVPRHHAPGPHGIAYTVEGSGPMLVLIHGVCHSRAAWENVTPLLKDDFRVVTIDLPGHGESPEPHPIDAGVVDRILGDLGSFIDELTPEGEPKPHVAGNSLGGYLALELARRGHASSATAFSPAGFFHGPQDQKRTVAQFLTLRAVGRVIKPMIPFLSRSKAGRAMMMGMFSAKPWGIAPEAVVRDANNLLRNTVIDHGLEAKFDFSPDTAGVPQTCYWGTRDLTLIRGWERHADILPDAALHLLPGLGHVPMLDDARTIADSIRRGIDRA